VTENGWHLNKRKEEKNFKYMVTRERAVITGKVLPGKAEKNVRIR
jgi:hypothetical protein